MNFFRLILSRRALAVFFVLLAPLRLDAQPCADCSLEEQARVATTEGRLTDADRLLTLSLQQEPSAATAYNLALVKTGRGALGEARVLFESLLAGGYGELPAERREVVASRLVDVVARLATLVVAFEGDAEAIVRLDGRPSGGVLPGEQLLLRTDPGDHSLRVSTTDGREREFSVGLQEGERRTLEVSLAPFRESAGEEPARPRRRWPRVLGVVLGVLAVGAVVTVVVVRRSGEGTPALPADFLGTSEALLAF